MEDHRPVPYEELHWESFASLNPIKFRGLRFSVTKLFSEKFSVTHNMNIPADHCQYGAKYIDPKLVLVGRVKTDGTHGARVKANITDKLSLKVIGQAKEKGPRWGWSHYMLYLHYMGPDCRALLQLGNGDDAVVAGNYIQRVSPGLSLGGEFLWTFLSGKILGIGCAARYETDKMVASAQVDTTGRVHMSSLQKISKEASLAGDFIYNLFSRDVKASVGCDYNFGQSRVRGKIGSNGVASALLEERTNMGLTLLLSAELDLKKNYKFGFGIIVVG